MATADLLLRGANVSASFHEHSRVQNLRHLLAGLKTARQRLIHKLHVRNPFWMETA
jgi:hypothetical protein